MRVTCARRAIVPQRPEEPNRRQLRSSYEDRRPYEWGWQHSIAASAEASREQYGSPGRVERQPVVGVKLAKRVDGLPMALMRCVRRCTFEHADER